ncbi:hypothetical protein WA158_001376 [Blastocystis sp. Blastoise]
MEATQVQKKQIKNICCVGAGYVGGPTMAVIAKECPEIHVTVVDVDAKRIEAWNSDSLPIFEPGLHEIVMECRGRNLFFSNDVETEIDNADVIFLAVNTPTKTFGIGAGSAANLKFLELATRTIARVAKSDKIVVEKSTVPVRTAATLERIFKENSKVHFDVVNNPEFLAEGTAINDLLHPARILLGSQKTPSGLAAVEALVDLYARWVPRERIITTNVWSSELAKLTANSFLAQRISSINSISAVCEAVGADVCEVSRAVGADPRLGNKFLTASIGFGGSCFQKDVLDLVYLAQHYGLDEVADYWKQVINMNDYQKRRFAQHIIHDMFDTVNGKRICMFGFAYKKNTGDTRETPAAYIAKNLLDEQAKIMVYDPKVTETSMFMELEYTLGVNEETCPKLNDLITMVKDPIAATQGAHAILIMTEWDEFKTFDYKAIYDNMMKPAYIFDGRNILDHKALREIGFEVHNIGRN